MDLEKVDIELKLSGTYWDRAPYAQVWINDTVIHSGVITDPITINHSVELHEGDNQLVVELLAKTKNQTVIENGQIVKDQLLNIDAISFDEIAIGHLTHLLSTYYPEKDPTINAPDELKKCVNLGYNGRWVLPFKVPIYVWLLENL